jgi:lactoylglutathione lyase
VAPAAGPSPATVRIEHAALWTEDLERARAFYERFLGAVAGEPYRNERTGLETRFLAFGGGPRLELMRRPDVAPRAPGGPAVGYAHVAFALGSEAAVDELTEAIRAAGHTVADGPRRTGDGYYESVVLDPDGNRVELTV